MARQERYLRKRKHLRALYRALIATTRSLGYKYRLVSGDNGEHFGYPHQTKKICVGGDQSLTDKIVILAHEVGHALDFLYNPLTLMELLEIASDFSTYEVGKTYYAREKAAWKYAKELLLRMRGYNAVKVRFQQLKKRNLSAYYRRMTRTGGNTNTNQG